jgi:hypothetical protein
MTVLPPRGVHAKPRRGPNASFTGFFREAGRLRPFKLVGVMMPFTGSPTLVDLANIFIPIDIVYMRSMTDNSQVDPIYWEYRN